MSDPASGNATPAAVQHDRRAPRKRSYYGGKIVHRDGSCSFDCVIRDISGSGAKIEIREHELIPRRFYLLCTIRKAALDAEMVWRRGGLAGLKVHATHDLETSGAPGLKFVKRLFAEFRARPSAGL